MQGCVHTTWCWVLLPGTCVFLPALIQKWPKNTGGLLSAFTVRQNTFSWKSNLKLHQEKWSCYNYLTHSKSERHTPERGCTLYVPHTGYRVDLQAFSSQVIKKKCLVRNPLMTGCFRLFQDQSYLHKCWCHWTRSTVFIILLLNLPPPNNPLHHSFFFLPFNYFINRLFPVSWFVQS